MLRDRGDGEAFLLEIGGMVCILGTENGSGQLKEAAPILGPSRWWLGGGNRLSQRATPLSLPLDLCLLSPPCPAQPQHWARAAQSSENSGPEPMSTPFLPFTHLPLLSGLPAPLHPPGSSRSKPHKCHTD